MTCAGASKLYPGTAGCMKNARNFERLRCLLINDQVPASHRPEKDQLIGQVGALVAKAGIFCRQLAPTVNIGLKLISGRRVVTGDVKPDLLQVGQGFGGQLVAIYYFAARLFDHFFLNADISACTRSAERVRPARIESIPALILP